jgi:flagellar hook-associated protein 3 FlgL
MNMTSIGDLAQGLMLRSQSTRLTQSIATLTDELSTGRTSDVSARLGGDFSYLADMDRNLARLEGFAIAAAETALFAEASQLGLGRISDRVSELGKAVLSSGQSGLQSVRDNLGRQAKSGLQATIAALNANVGGRALFGGTATDRAPLGKATALLDGLKLAVTGAATTDAILQAAEDWFSNPAGFRSTMYVGSDQALAPVQVGPGEQVSLSLRADDPVFRKILQNMAVAALATDTDLGYDADTQKELQATAGNGLLTGQERLRGLRSDLGFAQARIEESSTRNASARTGLEYAKSALLGADPYETATRLKAAQFQLESLYAVTVRTSRLTLLSFMR